MIERLDFLSPSLGVPGVWHLRAIGYLVVLFLLGTKAVYAAGQTPSQIYTDHVGSVVQFDVIRDDGKRLTATGFIVASGIVATNAHVVRDFGDGQVFFGSPPARAIIEGVLAARPEVDLALVSVPGLKANSPTPLKLAVGQPSGELHIGEPVYIIGNPGGLTNSFAQGLLSARRKLEGFDTLQLTVSATHGSSGSPVFNQNGHVVGIVRSTAISGTDIVLATPVSYLNQMLRERLNGRSISAANASPERGNSYAHHMPSQSVRANGDDASIVLGVPKGVSAEATAHILKAAVEAKYPYKVNLRRGTNAEILQGVARRNGRYDVHVEVWVPNQGDLWNTFVRGDSNIVASSGYAGFQGLCTNGPVSERHGITAVSDLRNPRIAALFDTDGDGKGNIWLGDPGWNAPDINKVKIRDQGLAPFYSGFLETEISYLPRLERRLAENKPTLFYCYLPHWLGERYDFVTLREPPYSPECYSVKNPDVDDHWFENSVARCGGPTPRIHIVYSQRLSRTAPGVARLLSKLPLTASRVSQWARFFKESDAPPSRAAMLWLARNPSFADLRDDFGR